MVHLSDYEKSVLDGKEGKLKQVCLENIVRYAEILGAEELPGGAIMWRKTGREPMSRRFKPR